ncbi:L-ascorbate peroxidase T [Hibiscus syriacus]|uniref:L-ascorbate peroxidase T n=1 Tax=Hibiscus syriacus TaxID=106335 RepID=A0A6A3BFF7_HIBSY|nr:L-ascorbate peroxidase T [Hibiscus syriacus]
MRKFFYRMGFNDKEIVALSGARTLGRARPERSSWGKPETKYTEIKAKRDEDLFVLPIDAVLFEAPSFKLYAEKYAEDQDTFFKDFAEAHAKLSNLGAKFDPPEGIILDAAP